MKYFFFIFLFVFLQVNAQQPSHFIWGQEELAGVDVYDILQDVNGDYWIASDQGVFNYDGRTFQNIELKQTKSQSVFNLLEDHSGNIYCNNLSGQIFVHKESSFEVMKELPDSLLSPYIFMELNNDNDLILATNSIFTIDQKGEFNHLEKLEKVPFSDFCKRSDGTLILQLPSLTYYYHIDGVRVSKINYQDTPFPIGAEHYIIFLEIEKKLHAWESGSKKLYQVEKGGFLPVTKDSLPLENVRVKNVKGDLWMLNSKFGCNVFDGKGEVKYQNKTLFDEHFLSSLLVDREGNVLLGTFGAGMMFIPSNSVQDYSSFPNDEKIRSLTSGANGSAYVGTMAGNIYQVSAKGVVSKEVSEQKKNIEFIRCSEDQEKLFYGALKLFNYELNSKSLLSYQVGAVKDMIEIDKGHYLFATNVGVIYLSDSKEVLLNQKVLTPYANKSLFSLKNLKDRSFAIEFDRKTSSVYLATNQGLIEYSKTGELKEIQFNGSKISASDLLFLEGILYVSSINDGVLVFENGKLIDNWNSESQVFKIKEYNDYFVVSTDEGLKILSNKGEEIYEYGSSDGLYSNKITDFDISDNHLWVGSQKGLQRIFIDSNSFNLSKPNIFLEKVQVNGKIFSVIQQEIYPDSCSKFVFTLNSSLKRIKEEVKYYYQLEGVDNDWQISSYYNNIIEYKSLGPGSYLFKAKTVFRDVESVVMEYSFTIDYPYYQKGWFYMVSSFFGLLLLGGGFKYQLNRQKKKAAQINELNASKLTAIQSQMNPHFIFNALNSIQDLVLKGDVDNSYTYITKFANLVRRTLNYSDKDFIEFESEVRLIELYLTLEKLRFKREFEYGIKTNNIEDVLVPPMLIQPFIENSLVHGLLHKEGEKKILIEFELKEELMCTITDNGIGREKSAEIKQRQKGDHESFSVNAIKRRFIILQDHFGGDLGFEYQDLESNGVSEGTKVMLRIPIKRVL